MMRTERWDRLAEVYRHFARDMAGLDWSEGAADAAFLWESEGTPCDERNGYAVGKGMLNLTLAMWIEDLRKGYVCKAELLDPLPERVREVVEPMLANQGSGAFSWAYDHFERIHAEASHHRLRSLGFDPLTAT